MIKLTKTYVRPNTQVEFFNPKDKMDLPSKRHMKVTYIDSGMIVSNETTLSADGLTQTTVIVFNTEESWYQFRDDTIIQNSVLNARAVYNIENNITETTLTETI